MTKINLLFVAHLIHHHHTPIIYERRFEMNE